MLITLGVITIALGLICVRYAAIYADLWWVATDPWAAEHINHDDYTRACNFVSQNPYFQAARRVSCILAYTLTSGGLLILIVAGS